VGKSASQKPLQHSTVYLPQGEDHRKKKHPFNGHPACGTPCAISKTLGFIGEPGLRRKMAALFKVENMGSKMHQIIKVAQLFGPSLLQQGSNTNKEAHAEGSGARGVLHAGGRFGLSIRRCCFERVPGLACSAGVGSCVTLAAAFNSAGCAGIRSEEEPSIALSALGGITVAFQASLDFTVDA